MTKHTPLPWKPGSFKYSNMGDDFDKLPEIHCVETDFHATGKIKNGPEAMICDTETSTRIYSHAACVNHGFSYTITAEERKANMEFIVRACNAHYGLVAACEWTLTVLKENLNRKQDAIAILEKALKATNFTE